MEKQANKQNKPVGIVNKGTEPQSTKETLKDYFTNFRFIIHIEAKV